MRNTPRSLTDSPYCLLRLQPRPSGTFLRTLIRQAPLHGGHGLVQVSLQSIMQGRTLGLGFTAVDMDRPRHLGLDNKLEFSASALARKLFVTVGQPLRRTRTG